MMRKPLCIALLGILLFTVSVRAEEPSIKKPGLETSNVNLEKKPEAKEVLKSSVPTESAALKLAKVESGEAGLGNGKAVLKSWDLKRYHRLDHGKHANVDFETVTHFKEQLVFSFNVGSGLEYLNNVPGTLTTEGNPEEGDGAILWSYEDDKVKLTRKAVFKKGNHAFDLLINAEFKSEQIKPSFAYLSMKTQAIDHSAEAESEILYYSEKKSHRYKMKDFKENLIDDRSASDVEIEKKYKYIVKQIPTPVKWIGVKNQYFMLTAVADQFLPQGVMEPIGDHGGQISFQYPIQGKSVSIPMKVYFGPMELDVLKKIEPSLDLAVDYGFIAYPIFRFMQLLYGFTHNYGIAIIVLTLILKILTFPLNYKSMKSMKQMALFQPQLQKLREKYKDDKEKLNREMLTMMKTHGYNPMAGCLPMLIQLPIFFALFAVLRTSVELYQAPFYAWIQDLSAKDPYYITPIILTITMFVQQKMTPNTIADPTQQKIMQFMPVVFGLMMINFASGLTIYMLTNALASIVQQFILNKKLGPMYAPPVPAR